MGQYQYDIDICDRNIGAINIDILYYSALWPTNTFIITRKVVNNVSSIPKLPLHSSRDVTGITLPNEMLNFTHICLSKSRKNYVKVSRN